MPRKSKKAISSKNVDAKLSFLQKEKMHYQMTGQYMNAQKIFQKIEELKANITTATSSKIKTKQSKQLLSMKKEQI